MDGMRFSRANQPWGHEPPGRLRRRAARVPLFFRRVRGLPDRPRIAPERGLIFLAALAGLFLAVGVLAGTYPGPAMAAEPTALEAAEAVEQALVEAIAAAESSVVSIGRFRRGETDANFAPQSAGDLIPNEFGTGVIVDAGGAILTCAHVISKDSESEYVVTTSDRRRYKARIKGADPRSDLAVLEIPASNLPAIKFGDAKTLRKGQIVIALGNPYAIARDGQVSASWGIVSNLSRKLAPDETLWSKPTLHHFGTLIQTDAKLNWGTSGGALINLKGEMVGLTTALAAVAGFEQAAGYAVPVDETFLRAVETLKAGREVEYGFLGVQPMELDPERQLRGERGALIREVVAGTPADRANLRPQDVVTAVNGEAIHDVDGLMLEVGKLPADAEVRLAVQREGRLFQLVPRLAKYPVEGRKIITTPPPRWRGMEVDYVTAQRSASLLPRLDPGWVVVTRIEPGSATFQAGISEGMRITQVGNTPVQTPKEFFAAVAGHSDVVELTVWSPPDTRAVKHVAAASE